MAIEAYEYETWVTGSAPRTTTVLVASGQTFVARKPLGLVKATGKVVAWNPAASDGSQEAVFISAVGVDASAGDKSAAAIYSGGFNPELIDWPAGATDAQKRGAFVGTPITLQSPQD